MMLRSWFFWNRLGGDEIRLKSRSVRIEQVLDAFGVLGLQNEADVMILGDAVRDFRIGVGRSVGMFLARKRKNHGSVVAARRRKLVGLVPCPNSQAGPLSPEVASRGGFDDIGNVGAADAGSDFDEIKLTVGMGPQELGMRDSAH